MKRVYICSPLRGDIKGNIEKAKKYCKLAIKMGYLPIAPHVYFTQFLDDRRPAERAQGLQFGLDLLNICDEIWVFGAASEGMKTEIDMADDLNMEIRFHSAIEDPKNNSLLQKIRDMMQLNNITRRIRKAKKNCALLEQMRQINEND